ncbi:hypothetical protein [Prochlorococcus marinus]|uniref:Uncharacterized protein n=1 Tax=Prochlorococcus marinus (strain MIT 9303) TaxID=59922 RepID=A2CBG5_PROM3|nr:hypothetical protein [Prochlorococcus marinus]ABM78825.1 hypothetical protein P9303_20901 [Prochlorococcus marinus str. MIT 9303]
MSKIHRYKLHYLQSRLKRNKPPKGEEGLALLLALLTGLTLLAGTTGLLIRQLMARKIGAAQSYQQMAEAAALNGFNRILNTLNSNDPENYKGYLFTINNGESASTNNWIRINTTDEAMLEELCTNITALPNHPSNQDAVWPTGLVAKGNNETKVSLPFIEDQSRTQRNDGKGSIQTFYRLRQYKPPAKDIQGSYEGRKGAARFQVEGFTKRVGSEDNYLARALLSRSLFVRSVVSKPEDWGVMGANNYDLGTTTIDGPGLILLNVSNKNEIIKDDGSCRNDLATSLLNNSSNALRDRIWPVMNRGLPATELFANTKNSKEGKEIFDADSKRNDTPRVWSFDDTSTNNDFECGEDQIVCTRTINSTTMSVPKGIDIDYDIIGRETVKEYVWKDGFDLSAKRICGGQYCYTPHPTRSGWWLRVTADKFYPSMKSLVEIETEKDLKKWTIRIKKQDICSNTDEACHLYIEHINLENTSLLIENDQRPVVLHLGTQDETKLSNRIDLSENSLLCGVNRKDKKCNEAPEKLIVISKNSLKSSKKCNSNDLKNNQKYVLNIAGKSLPAAFVLLKGGTFTLSNDAEMRGVVWADNFCSQSKKFSLTTKDQNSLKGSVIEAGDELWNLVDGEEYTGYGRTITRGVRGTGLDIFQRW